MGNQGRSHLAIRMSPGTCSRNDVGAYVTGGGVSPDAVARGTPERLGRDLDGACGAAAVVDGSGGAVAEDSAAAVVAERRPGRGVCSARGSGMMVVMEIDEAHAIDH